MECDSTRVAQPRVRGLNVKKLPFFIPFQGCGRRCVYCNQNVITGSEKPIAVNSIRSQIAVQTEPVEICFFGGSFAQLPLSLLIDCLEATRLAPKGSTIRFSTYPTDLLDPKRALLFESYPLSRVELGIPSLDPAVLEAAGREETAEAITEALKLLSVRYPLGVQIMTGLPKQSAESSLRDIEHLAQIKGNATWELRIYPCLVLEGTALKKLYMEGKYMPPSLEEAVLAAGKLMDTAKQKGFTVIRTGLQSSKSLERSIIAGPWHPAFGELATSAALVYGLTRENNAIPWAFPKAEISKFYGHRRFGLRLLQRVSHLSMETVMERLRFF